MAAAADAGFGCLDDRQIFSSKILFIMENAIHDGLQRYASLQLNAAQTKMIKGGSSQTNTDADDSDIVIVDLIAP